MQEFAFDCKLAAVVRVKAPDEERARQVMQHVLDAMEINEHWQDGYNQTAGDVKITEVSLDVDDSDGPMLFEVDGEAVD